VLIALALRLAGSFPNIREGVDDRRSVNPLGVVIAAGCAFRM